MITYLLCTVLLAIGAHAEYECGLPAFPIIENSYGKRIVGGWEAKPHSIPWQVRVMTFKEHNDHTFGACGGSLIQFDIKNGTDIVLSAAHCVHDQDTNRWARMNKVKVLVGAHHLDSSDESSQRIVYTKQYVDAGYNPKSHENDIILIKLREVVPYTEYTRPVCLPKQDDPLPEGSKCFVSGWGTTSENGQSSRLLLMVDVNLYKETDCYLLPEKQKVMFCAGHNEGGKDSCQGDSGGPMVCKFGNTWTQYGVVSFGAGCARRGSPGVYARVPHYINWLKEKDAHLTSLPNLSDGPTGESTYEPSGSGPTSHPTQILTDSYYISPSTNFESIFNKPSALGFQSSFLPSNKPFESVEVGSHFGLNGALKPGFSNSISGLGFNRPSMTLSRPSLSRPSSTSSMFLSGSRLPSSGLPSSVLGSSRPTYTTTTTTYLTSSRPTFGRPIGSRFY